MAVRVISAPPGHGKTLNMTRIAIKIFREQNPFLKRIKKNYILYNSIYSNYPILLWYQKKPFKYQAPGCDTIYNSIPMKKIHDEDLDQDYYEKCSEEEHEIYGMLSNKLRFTDMRLKYNFGKDASFFIDELQYIYDSMEYKDFPDCIAHFFQVHRHLNYNMIYTNSQSLSRVIKRVLCVSEEFWNVIELKQYFLLPFLSKTTFKITTDIVGSKNNENDLKEDINAEYITDRFFNKRVYNGYITKYLGELNKDLPYYNKGQFESLKMSKSDIIKGFMITNQEKEELKEMLF
jgi:hypothetical protein